MKFLKSAVAAVFFAAASISAQAAITMTIDDLSTVGVDWDSGVLPSGAIAFHGGSVGNWTLSNTTGAGNGWSDIFGVDLNSISASSKAGGTLRIKFTETDLSFGMPGPLSVRSEIGGTTQGQVTYAAWIDDANQAFGQGQQLFSGVTTGSPFAAAGSVMAAVSDPFSLTLIVDITHTGKKLTSFDFSANVPEPGTLALLGLALVGAGAASRRRKQA